jgi:hypothetical protein
MGMEVIDLCDDSETEHSSFQVDKQKREESSTTTTTTTTKSQQCARTNPNITKAANATSRSALSIELDCFGESSNDNNRSKRKTPSSNVTARSRATSITGNNDVGVQKHQLFENLAHPVTAEAKKRRKLAVEHAVEILDDTDDDTDDDDDELLNYSSGLRRRGGTSLPQQQHSDRKPAATGDPQKAPGQKSCSKDDGMTNTTNGKSGVQAARKPSVKQVEIDLTMDDSPISKNRPPVSTNTTKSKPPDETTRVKEPSVPSHPHHASPAARQPSSLGTAAAVVTTSAPINNPYRSASKASAPLTTRQADRSSLPSNKSSSPVAREHSSTAPSVATTATPVVNPYRSASKSGAPSMVREANRTSTSQFVPLVQAFPRLLGASYPDERARFLLAFWTFGRRKCTQHSYQKAKLDIIAKRIVKLALAVYPIRSLEEFVSASSSHKAVSELSKSRQQMEEDLLEGGLNSIAAPHRSHINPTGRRKFYSIVEAALSGFLRTANDRLEDGHDLEFALKDKAMWISLEDFIPIIDQHLLPCVPNRLSRAGESDHGAGYYTDKGTRSMEFMQITKLETNICDGPYLKRHQLGSKVHFELLPAGLQAARRIDSRDFPERPGHYRSSKSAHKAFEGICIGTFQPVVRTIAHSRFSRG